ncbi:MAG: DUF1343 domain-containing protein [Bdellovibrionaceae bacterium]|nr:DUF1343 domain-containing protein [Pseudobdellovibrionaceae bacterium]
MKFGLDRLLTEDSFKKELEGKRLSLVAHPASVTSDLRHSVDALFAAGYNLVSAFGPQHGLRGEKQDNMIETDDFVDPQYRIPVFSLYGKSRRPTDEAMATFDVCLFDLQDVGTRIYTFLTTLRYMMEACARHGKTLWILDRPNPAGRPVEGSLLRPGWESFVGAGPFPMRHGLTLGECALWFRDHLKLNLDLRVIEMTGYAPEKGPGYGWPAELSWVNPSPNAASVNMARCFPGTVMLEGTHLSEARGTTKPLEMAGASDISIMKILKRMESLASEWMRGALIRPCYFEPTFHKHQKQLCEGFQIHTDHPSYRHEEFRPYRLFALFFKALRLESPDYPIWRDFPYEYETERLAIDLINGGPQLREWVDDRSSTAADFEKILQPDESAWRESSRHHLY